jgi:hypothetical protein
MRAGRVTAVGRWRGPWVTSVSVSISGDPLRNLSFEDAGLFAGEAEFWSSSFDDPAGAYAAWDVEFGEEGFELWWELISELVDGDTDAAFFVILLDGADITLTRAFESMGTGWPGTDTYISEVGNSEDAGFGGDADAFDGFESDWLSADYIEEVTLGDLIGDDFEMAWGNDAYITDVTMPPASALTTAQFGTEFGLVGYCDFEGVQLKVVGTADATNDYINVISHNFAAGERVTLIFEGIPPGGLQQSTTYFVNVISATKLQLLDDTSSVVDITSDGTHPLTLVPDGTLFWYDSL